MKMTFRRLRRIIEGLLTETKCPNCGSPEAYVGMHEVECPNPTCKFFSKRQAADTNEFTCPKCGVGGGTPCRGCGYDPGSDECPECGGEGSEPCRTCGYEPDDDEDMCPECGESTLGDHADGCSMDPHNVFKGYGATP